MGWVEGCVAGAEAPGTVVLGTDVLGMVVLGTEVLGTDVLGTEVPGTDVPGVEVPGTALLPGCCVLPVPLSSLKNVSSSTAPPLLTDGSVGVGIFVQAVSNSNVKAKLRKRLIFCIVFFLSAKLVENRKL